LRSLNEILDLISLQRALAYFAPFPSILELLEIFGIEISGDDCKLVFYSNYPVLPKSFEQRSPIWTEIDIQLLFALLFVGKATKNQRFISRLRLLFSVATPPTD
jgi:hypothetical protein